MFKFWRAPQLNLPIFSKLSAHHISAHEYTFWDSKRDHNATLPPTLSKDRKHPQRQSITWQVYCLLRNQFQRVTAMNKSNFLFSTCHLRAKISLKKAQSKVPQRDRLHERSSGHFNWRRVSFLQFDKLRDCRYGATKCRSSSCNDNLRCEHLIYETYKGQNGTF